MPEAGKPALANTCAIRLVVGIVKWCSGREACSAGDVAEALDNPRKLFKPTTALPESLCWIDTPNEEKTYRLPGPESVPKLIDLAVRLVAFLSPAAKGEERTRALAMVRWLFAVVRTVNKEALVDQIEQIFSDLLEPDYMRAITVAFTVANAVCASERCKDLPEVKKALGFIGAVASYMQTYEETKALDTAEAHNARKKAIESLIDSATNREGRGGDAVYSIGVPVGLAAGFRLSAGTDSHYGSTADAYDLGGSLQWRVPLAIARQGLPDKEGFWGTHLALWVADLGQFTRSRPQGTTDAIKWQDFIGVGLQAGFLLGSSDHSIVIAAEASYSPGLFARDVTIKTQSTTEVRRVEGAFTFGLTLAYYVPLFDLN